MKKLSIVGALVIALSGCGSIPTDPAQKAVYYTAQAKEKFTKGVDEFAFMDVFSALELPGGAQHIKNLFATDAKVGSAFLTQMRGKFATMGGGVGISMQAEYLDRLKAAGVLSNEDEASLFGLFERILVDGNESGSIPLLLTTDNLKIKPLASAKQRRILFDRTIAAYSANSGGTRDMGAMLEYLHSLGPTSEEFRLFKSKLPQLNVRANELPMLSSVDPAFVERRTAEISLKAALVAKNADRIFLDDLKSTLNQSIKGVTWLPEDADGVMQVVVERVRNQEKEVPPATRTVTYAFHEVDIVSAVLFMPRGASYQFDLRTGGAELEYGYVVSTWLKGKKLSEEVVRGKLGGESRSCENARIVNVFGGVSSAGFQANDNMRSLCSSQGQISMDSLRSQVFDKIAGQVLQISDVARVHQLN